MSGRTARPHRRPGKTDEDPIKAKAFALLDAMNDAGLDESMIGTMLLGMAASALDGGGKTRAEMHTMIDAILDAKGRP